MAGFTEPNRYEPRQGWRQTLAQWVQSPPGPEESWQYQISRYWRWRTLDGMPLRAAWAQLGMFPATARMALVPASSNESGLVPPEVFSRMLARSRAVDIKPGDNVDPVVIPEPDKQAIGFDRTHNIYQPRRGWRATLDLWVLDRPPGAAGGFAFDLYYYWLKRKKGESLVQAWTEQNMSQNNAYTSLDPGNDNRGSIPPDLIGHVVARADHSGEVVTGILLYPELAT